MSSQNQSSGKSSQSDKVVASEFINVGLQRWERLRAEWRRSKSGSVPRPEVISLIFYITLLINYENVICIKVHAKNIDVEEYMERVFSLTVGGTLPEPIPLGQMIDILIDSWEADGLFGK